MLYNGNECCPKKLIGTNRYLIVRVIPAFSSSSFLNHLKTKVIQKLSIANTSRGTILSLHSVLKVWVDLFTKLMRGRLFEDEGGLFSSGGFALALWLCWWSKRDNSRALAKAASSSSIWNNFLQDSLSQISKKSKRKSTQYDNHVKPMRNYYEMKVMWMYQLTCLFTFNIFLSLTMVWRSLLKSTAIDMRSWIVPSCRQGWHECSTNVFKKFIQGTKISKSWPWQCID